MIDIKMLLYKTKRFMVLITVLIVIALTTCFYGLHKEQIGITHNWQLISALPPTIKSQNEIEIVIRNDSGSVANITEILVDGSPLNNVNCTCTPSPPIVVGVKETVKITFNFSVTLKSKDVHSFRFRVDPWDIPIYMKIRIP
ncbi:MAG: hypothetical protein QXW80_04805 [Candidatus Micrarchaeia archaeon]